MVARIVTVGEDMGSAAAASLESAFAKPKSNSLTRPWPAPINGYALTEDGIRSERRPIASRHPAAGATRFA